MGQLEVGYRSLLLGCLSEDGYEWKGDVERGFEYFTLPQITPETLNFWT